MFEGACLNFNFLFLCLSANGKCYRYEIFRVNSYVRGLATAEVVSCYAKNDEVIQG